jgi:hypothetical protein
VASASFLEGTYEYTEPITTLSALLGAAQINFAPVAITPGGYLRGLLCVLSASGGTTGAGVASGDFPWDIYQNLELVSVDGTDLIYPMGGYSTYVWMKFTRPWDGDPALDPYYTVASIVAPALRFRFFVEGRFTLGVVPNTDARAQYRFNCSYNPTTGIYSTAVTTPPTVNTDVYLETYAQPEPMTQAGQPISQYPPGMAYQREVSHQSGIPFAGGDVTVQSNRVGNLIRTMIWVMRAAPSGGFSARTDPGGDPYRLRLDNTTLLTEKRTRADYEVSRFYGGLGLTTLPTRPTGVIVFPRWHNPGKMDGPAWLPTKTASFLALEINDSTNALAGGSIEIITEDLAMAGEIPNYLRDV